MRKVVVALAAMLAFGPAAAQDAPAVKARIDSGVVVGRATGAVSVFRGIPFAAPPVGPLRWAPPQRPAAWSGERTAAANGSSCLQRGGQGSEDCLYLNVFAPKDAKAAPVMVWIHGGSNTGGSGGGYDGTNFARDGVVLVTINYRLGSMGFFAHPAITKAAKPGEPLGNYAFMDQIAALQWVQRNIAAFGGDPNNVTVFGESAGAMDIFALLGIPSAKGLFHKAILESNIGWGGAVPLATKEQQGAALATAAGLSGEVTAEQLRALPSATVMAQRGSTSTTIDGRMVTESTYQAFAAGRAIDVPLIVGWNSYEASLGSRTGPEADAFTDGQAGAPARFIAAKQESGAPSWLYYFSFVTPAERATALGARHAAEIGYVFDYDRVSARSAEDKAMASYIHSCWVGFARTGRPACASGPAWPAYTAAGDQLLEFGAESGVRTAFRKTQLDAAEQARTRIADRTPAPAAAAAR